MGMKARVLFSLLAVAQLAAARAFAAEALGQARGAASDPASFDGARARPESGLVREGSSLDRRTAAQIARDEQLRADARAGLAAKPHGPDREPEPPKPNEWLKPAHIYSGIKGTLIGLLIGSLWGLTGLGLGALIGGMIGYSLSRFAAKA